MSDTLPSIELKAEEWVDVYTLIPIDPGAPIDVQNTGVTDVYYSISNHKPERDSRDYKIFKRGETVVLNEGDTNAWFFSPQCAGLINVEQFNSSIENLLMTLISEFRKFANNSNDQNCFILLELKLLNARFEEMADTTINENDIGK
jgi:hypothetical protein